MPDGDSAEQRYVLMCRKIGKERDRYKEALKKIDNLDHDEQCMSDQGSRDGDCMDDHRCYCAARIARKALSES